MTVLANEPLGSFMVRQSETQAGVLALSVRVPKTFHPLGITHYIISRLDTGGYQIKVRRPPARAAALLTTLFISFSGQARVQLAGEVVLKTLCTTLNKTFHMRFKWACQLDSFALMKTLDNEMFDSAVSVRSK